MPGSVPQLPTELVVKRSDPVYNAHAYLTKVPFSAIVPFIEAFTEPGDIVLDVFAGSGMTGVASAMTGRRAELRDISALGRHIGRNYLNLVDADRLRTVSRQIRERARRDVGDIYAVECDGCRRRGSLAKTVWSVDYACPACDETITYYDAFEAAAWKKKNIRCPGCSSPFDTRAATRVGERAVLDYVHCDCTSKQRVQPHSAPLAPVAIDISYPDVEIGDQRQMYVASALKKHNLLSTASFFSKRNLAALATLHAQIHTVRSADLREKLMFAFTAILTRASKRYQWHPKRPLNASNQNYYIAPVFFEWNVFELFDRKVDAALRSDAFVRDEMARNSVSTAPRVEYRSGSADAVDLPDGSIDYVFTDPPFGSQIFYSDMNLFQEAWLGRFTDDSKEAVVLRTGAEARRSGQRYEQLLTGALEECRRVLRRDGWLSLVFSNSNGRMWLLAQRAIRAAGFVLEHVTLLDKGQRSVKGLASGFESIVTADLILTMRKARPGEVRLLDDAPLDALHTATEAALRQGADTPTRVYLSIVTTYLRNEWKVTGLTMAGIRAELLARGYELDSASGRLVHVVAAA